MNKQEQLLTEFQKARKQIKTDSYNMSISQIINLYRDEDLIITPAYQRLFRWNNQQKTKFIESILMGIPIPQIFVTQDSDGRWSIVDGLQRISTILQLTGDLKDQEPLVLAECENFPSIEGCQWDDLPKDLQRIFRRSILEITIIFIDNSIYSQHIIFQRLNSDASHLSVQEIRNNLVMMLDEEFYKKLNELKKYRNFIKCLSLSQDLLDKEYHMELILIFFIAKNQITDYKIYKLSTSLFDDFIDKEIAKLINNNSFKINQEINIFKKTFDLLKDNLGKDSFRRYNLSKEKFESSFSKESFELIAPGVANNLSVLEQLNKNEFIKKVKILYKKPEVQKLLEKRQQKLQQFKELAELSSDYFSR